MAIKTEQLGVHVGEQWLFRGLDLTVPAGRCLALMGSNGAGKSTLLRCLYGMQAPTEGTVAVFGETPDERSPAFRRRVSVLFDDSDFFAELSPRQHLELLHTSFDSLEGRDIDELLADAGLGDRAEIAAGGLSAGQRRRLLLMGAIARPNEVLLLDEPERALDVDGKQWLGELVGGAAANGAAVVMATHHPSLLDVADQVVELG